VKRELLMTMTVVLVGAAVAARLPVEIEYDGPLTEAKSVMPYAFAAEDGSDSGFIELSPMAFKPGRLTYTPKGKPRCVVALPEGLNGTAPVVKLLGDGRVVIAYVGWTCDAKVYGYRGCAWIGPWASLKNGSVRGFYRVVFSRPDARGTWLPDVAKADAQFRAFAAARAQGTGGWDKPIEVDLTGDPARYSTVNESEFYDAHATSVMLPDEKTLYCFWDLAHGGPTGPAAMSTDAGRTWTRIDERIPAEFKKLHDAPVAFRFIDPKTGKARIRVFAGYERVDEKGSRGAKDRVLKEAMPSIMSEDDGATWKYVPPMGEDFRCVISFFGMEHLKDGSYFGVFHRGSQLNGDGSPLEVLGTYSRDGGLTWEKPFVIAHDERFDLCEPAVFYSPDKTELCMLIRENKGKGPSQMCFSKDEGKTWTKIQDAPLALNGHRHVVQKLPDGRYLVVFRRVDFSDPHVFGWVGPYSGIRDGSGRGGYLVKLFQNYGSPFDCGYQGMHLRRDGEIIINTYDKFRPWANATPSIVSMRFKIDEADALVKGERAYWADQLAAIDEAQKGVEPTKEVLAPYKSVQTIWTPFPKGCGFKPVTEATVHGFVKSGVTDLGVMKFLPSKNVKDVRGAIDISWAVDLKLEDRPWWDPPFTAFVTWKVNCEKAGKRTIRIKNDYFGTVYVNGEHLPSSYGTDGSRGFRPFYGNWTEGMRFDVNLKAGENEIILVTSPGGNNGGQWISALGVEE